MTPEEVLEKLRNSRLLTIQDYDKINPLDHADWPEVNAPIKEYDREYPNRLKRHLGVDIVVVRSKELNEGIRKVEEKEAEEIADMWINEAQEVRRGVTRQDVIRAAILYRALKLIIKKYDADSITMADWHLAGCFNKDPKTNVMPPLAWMELSKEHIPCCSEGLIDCLVTQMIGAYITDGYPGFVGDILNNWVYWDSFLAGPSPGDVVIIGHCGAPINPHGVDRIPYTIRDHVISNKAYWAKMFGPNTLFGPEDTATATTVDWPTGEVASIVKFDVYRKKAFIVTGTVLDGNSLYKHFSDTACRNKIVIKIEKPEVYEMLSGGRFRCHWGIHAVVFYGDLRSKIIDFAKLVGFSVIGEGR